MSKSINPGSCRAEEYRVRLSTGTFFADDLGGEVGGAKLIRFPSSLQPAAEYAWMVYPPLQAQPQGR